MDFNSVYIALSMLILLAVTSMQRGDDRRDNVEPRQRASAPRGG